MVFIGVRVGGGGGGDGVRGWVVGQDTQSFFPILQNLNLGKREFILYCLKYYITINVFKTVKKKNYE